MEMTVTPLDGGVQLVSFNGALDIAGTGEIDLAFSAIAGSSLNIVVDLENVSYLASIGIRSIVANAKTVQRRGGKMVLLNPQPNVGEVLQVTGIDKVIPVCTDIDQALSEISVTSPHAAS